MPIVFPLIETAIQTILQTNVALFSGTDPVTGSTIAIASTADIQIAEIPKVQDQIDNIPCIRICQYGDPKWEKYCFEEPAVNWSYVYQVTVITPNNVNYQTKLGVYQQWWFTLSRILYALPEYQGVYSNLWNLEIVQNVAFDRSKLSSLYDYFGILLQFQSLENSTSL